MTRCSTGRYLRPPGAEFNDPDQLSPGEPTHIADPLGSI